MPTVNPAEVCWQGSAELGDTVRSGLLETTECKGANLRVKAEEDIALSVWELTISVGSAERILPKAIKPWENMRVDGGKTDTLSQKRTKTG